tara:strand:- start:376 stop:594 length:219 start_codon:yes stop_codon:yes gene_type:complete
MILKEDFERTTRGSNDLEERIERLEKQKKLLKFHCKKAGARIKDLEKDNWSLAKEVDRLNDYVQILELEKRK